MADQTTLSVPVPADQVLVFGTGGGGRTRAVYKDGELTSDVVQRDGAAIHRLTGVAVSVGGVGLDGATLETTTPMDQVPAGTIFKVEGRAEISVRADARPGFGDRGPRGVLAVSVYAQTLTPVGTVDALLKSGRRGANDA